MKNQIEIVKEIADGMEGIGGIPNNEEFYAEFDMRVREALGIERRVFTYKDVYKAHENGLQEGKKTLHK